MERRLEQAMAELKATEAAVREAEEELRAAECSVRSRDQVVEVTVGPQGELTDLRFLDDSFRTMSADELADSVLEAAGRARTAMSRHVMETLEPLTRPSGTVPELTGVDVDWAKIFGPEVLAEPDEDDRPRRRLRDEIGEDDDRNGA
ncbi:YbaB/EbfC family nucleoid-associated protein [Streptomyces sp. NPDC056716]|uniref:YbaB/EbfC family nucleoid-associated protein n=1 Tax=unclassified Streptomyces TaxID=2593676 RepID=UPI0036BC882E